METAQLVQQNNENLLIEEKPLSNTNGGFVEHSNGECVATTNGDCETNKMLSKGEAIELSSSQPNVRCCNGIFIHRGLNKKNKQKLVKESQVNGSSNANGNGKCYFDSFKEKLSNGKHTQLIDDNCDIKKAQKTIVFDDRDPFKINSNVKFEYLNLFAEPNSGTYSFNPTWSFTSRLYFNLKLYLYRLLAIVIGIPSAFIWAILFALFSVIQIWLLAPIIRLFKAIFGIFKDIWSTIIDAVFGPIFQTIAHAFRSGYNSNNGCPSSVSSKSIYNEEVNVV